MPIVRADGKLIFYAHVPKCGGSAVSWYLRERFGAVAFEDREHTRHDPGSVWSRTSPQHVDRTSLGRLFPDGFFDATFTIVRHPVARLVSAYHFQHEVEGRVPEGVGFGEWLEDLADRRAEDPFVFDNHVRPMVEIVPEGAQVFHTEHGLDALVGWFDDLTGRKAAPRAVPRMNERGAHGAVGRIRSDPSEGDLARIAELYAADFERFGYRPGDAAPLAAKPVLSSEAVTERDAFLRTFDSPWRRIGRRIGARLRR